MAVTMIMGVTLTGYLVLRAHQPGTGAVIAEVLPGSRAMAALAEQRQQLIVEETAAHTMHLAAPPKVAAMPDTAANGNGGSAGGGVVNFTVPAPGTLKSIAFNLLPSFGFDAQTQFPCVDDIFSNESGWNPLAENASGAYGIPQALPGSKMASAGPDWQTNATTQISWGIGYMKSTYGSPCSAWAFWQANGWY
jgi:hypothetical protein